MAAPGVRSSLADPLVRFLLIALAAYLAWYAFYALVIHPWGGLDRWLIDRLAADAGWMLRLSGHELLPPPVLDNNRYIGVQGGHHLWVGDECNGLSVMAVFLVFIVAFPGPWKHRAWFAVVGVVTIHLLNALRVAVLCHITTIDYEWLTFNHDYTFYVVVYGWVFMLWYIWVARLSALRKR